MRRLQCAYYRERALPHLVRFPAILQARSAEQQIEGLEPWEMGDPLDELIGCNPSRFHPGPFPASPQCVAFTVRSQGSNGTASPLILIFMSTVRVLCPIPSSDILPDARRRHHCAFGAEGWSQCASEPVERHAQCISTSGFVRNDVEILTVLTGFLGRNGISDSHLRDTYAVRDPAMVRKAHI